MISGISDLFLLIIVQPKISSLAYYISKWQRFSREDKIVGLYSSFTLALSITQRRKRYDEGQQVSSDASDDAILTCLLYWNSISLVHSSITITSTTTELQNLSIRVHVRPTNLSLSDKIKRFAFVDDSKLIAYIAELCNCTHNYETR